MPTWNFIDGLKKEPIDSVNPRWTSALEAALQSQATPLQSGYHVNVGAVTMKGNVVSGSNHEMAITDTITHGEEAVIAAALEKYGKDDPIQAIAFAGLGGADIASPCGNCRDAIRQYSDLDNLVLINAPRDGGKAVLVPGKAYFKDVFHSLEVPEGIQLLYSSVGRFTMSRLDNRMIFKLMHGEEKTRPPHVDGVREALRAEKNAYDIYVTSSSPRIYGAAVVCWNGLVFRGSYRGDVAYHPELPISAAIGNFRDGSDDTNRRKVKEIIVAATGSIPDVMYKDRQHALEFAEAIRSLSGNPGTPLPVYLVNLKSDGQRTEIFKTDTNEWLPLRFSPKHLGLEKAMASGYEKLFRTL